MPVPEIVALVAENGLRAIEWGGDVHVPVGDLAAAERARSRCADAGVEITSYGSYHRAGAHDSASFEPVVRTAEGLGAPSIRVWAGDAGSAETSPARRSAVVNGLRAAVLRAAERGIAVALEFHRDTLTDTVESALRLWDVVGAVGAEGRLRSYWQPSSTVDAAGALREVELLRDRLSTVHVFSWARDGERLPLAAREELWQPVLAALGTDGVRRHALLEFVAADDPRAFARDAATLLAWVGDPTSR